MFIVNITKKRNKPHYNETINITKKEANNEKCSIKKLSKL